MLYNDFAAIDKYYDSNPFMFYFYGYDSNETYNIPTEVTYQLDVGLAIQNLKNAIISLGGNV